MKKPMRKKRSRLETNQTVVGLLFLIPLLFGLTEFFIVPIVKSFLFSIVHINFGSNGYSFGKFAGLTFYKEALLRNTEYRQTVVKAILNMLLTAPLVMIFSFFMASLLNEKFRGRTFFRVIMFIPIITTLAASKSAVETQMSGFNEYKQTFTETAVSFTSQISAYLRNMGLSERASSSIVGIADQVYDVISISGIQILIMIVGMCSISPLLYEAATVEGATAWESFWKITVPMAGPTIYACLIYTVIDSFTSSSNGLIELVSKTSFSSQKYSLASAMGWIYFLIIAILLGSISLIVSRRLFYYDQ